MIRIKPLFVAATLALLASASSYIHAGNVAESGYQLPPAELQAVVDAPRGPLFRLGPQRKTALLLTLPGLASIADVSQPELRLAGLRINPRTRAASHFDFGNGMSLLDIATGKAREVKGLPARLKIAETAWSPDEQWLAFSLWVEGGVELWLLDVKKGTARRLMGDKLNAVTGPGFSWIEGSEKLLVRLAPLRQKELPPPPAVPAGPNMQETKGGKTLQNRIYPDMLRTARDSDTLDWYLQTQLGIVTLNGEVRRITRPMTLIKSLASPDGKLILTTQLRRPYSTMLPVDRFAQLIELWDNQGKKIKTVAERPLRERIPTGNDAVQAGPRDFGWRTDKPATLYWLEAQAGGDPDVNSKIHDALFAPPVFNHVAS